MDFLLMLAIIFGGTVLGLAIVGSTILIAIKIIKGGVSPGGRKAQSEEARMVQELYQGLGRMEQRLEALETIVLTSTSERTGTDERV